MKHSSIVASILAVLFASVTATAAESRTLLVLTKLPSSFVTARVIGSGTCNTQLTAKKTDSAHAVTIDVSTVEIGRVGCFDSHPIAGSLDLALGLLEAKQVIFTTSDENISLVGIDFVR